MIAQRTDLLALQEIVMASALPKPIPALAAFDAMGWAVFLVSSVMSFVPPSIGRSPAARAPSR